MSIANEISRIQEARDTLRAKAVALGVGLSTDNLTQLATKYDGIVDRGTPNAEVKEGESVTLSAGYYHGGSIKGVAGGGGSWSQISGKPFNTIDGNTLVNRSGTLCVNTTDDAEQDNTRPITSSGVHVICGNINALLQAI